MYDETNMISINQFYNVLTACVCLLVFRNQFCKGLAQFLHYLLLQTIVKGLHGHSLSFILVHCHRSQLECLPTGLHHLRYLDIIERLFAVFHIKKIDPVLKSAILVSIGSHTCPSWHVTFNQSQTFRLHSASDWPIFDGTCQSRS